MVVSLLKLVWFDVSPFARLFLGVGPIVPDNISLYRSFAITNIALQSRAVEIYDEVIGRLKSVVVRSTTAAHREAPSSEVRCPYCTMALG
jgi:hypothetical protein